MVSTYRFNRFKYSTPMIWLFGLRLYGPMAHIEYRQPECHPKFFHIAKLRLST